MSVHARAVRHFGVESQLRMIQEECGELIAVLNQFQRGRALALQVVAEIADVEIMLKQARVIFGELLIDLARDRKELRLSQLLAKEGA